MNQHIKAVPTEAGADGVESTVAASGRAVVLSDEKLIAAACATVTTPLDHGHIAHFLPRWRAFVRHLSAQGQSGPVDAEQFLDGADVQDEGGLLTYYSKEAVLECVTAALEHVACESVITASPEAAPAPAAPSADASPDDELLVACITLNGTTLSVEANALADMFGTDDEQHTYELTFKRMRRAAFEALGEFNGF